MHEIKYILSNNFSQDKYNKYISRDKATRKVHRLTGNAVISLKTWRKREFEFLGSKDELAAIVQKLTNTDKQILTLLIRFTCRGLPSFMGQIYIAKTVGRNYTYVNERIQHLRKLGLISIYTRGKAAKNESNVYKVAQQFFDKNYWQELAIIPAIKSMLLGLLLLCPVMRAIPAHHAGLQTNPKLIKAKVVNLINSNLTDCKRSVQAIMKNNKNYQKRYEDDAYSIAEQERSVKQQLNRYRTTENHVKTMEEKRKLIAQEEAAGKSWKPLTPQQLFELFKC